MDTTSLQHIRINCMAGVEAKLVSFSHGIELDRSFIAKTIWDLVVPTFPGGTYPVHNTRVAWHLAEIGSDLGDDLFIELFGSPRYSDNLEGMLQESIRDELQHKSRGGIGDFKVLVHIHDKTTPPLEPIG